MREQKSVELILNVIIYIANENVIISFMLSIQSLFYVDVELLLNVIISFLLSIQSKLFYVDAFPKCMIKYTF